MFIEKATEKVLGGRGGAIIEILFPNFHKLLIINYQNSFMCYQKSLNGSRKSFHLIIFLGKSNIQHFLIGKS